jgi:hypothetical protein
MGENLSIVVNDDDDDDQQEQFIQVPIKRKDFGDFVTNLLGQQETILENKHCLFEVSMEWLIHLHHSIDQRIHQQSHSSLVDFSCKFSYVNGPARKITSINSFLHFNEGKIVETDEVEIIWTYLVNFPNKQTPEKQEIHLKVISNSDDVISFQSGPFRRVQTIRGLIAYKISHTERTWGDDIQTILSREIDTIVIENTRFNKIMGVFLPFLAIGLLIAGLVIPDYIDQLIKGKQIVEVYSTYVLEGQAIETLTIDKKLDLSLALLDPNNQIHTVSILYRVLSFFGGMFLAVFSIFALEDRRMSSLLITSEDKKRQSIKNTKNSRKVIISIFSAVVSITAGVIANYCYYYLNL